MSYSYNYAVPARPINSDIMWDLVFSFLGFMDGTHYLFDETLSNQPNESAFNAVTWIGPGTKPLWSEVLSIFSKIRYQMVSYPYMPGDIKISTQSADHRRWLLCSPGRTVAKDDFPLLYAEIGDAFTPGSTPSTHFGLPDPANRSLVIVGNSRALGSKGGSESVTLTTSHLPQHDHDLDDNIAELNGTTGVITSILGGILGSVNNVAVIGSSARTGNAGQETPTPLDTLSPYLTVGNLFINIGKDVFDTMSSID